MIDLFTGFILLRHAERREYILTTVLTQRKNNDGTRPTFRDSNGKSKPLIQLVGEGILSLKEMAAIEVLVAAQVPVKNHAGKITSRPLDLRKLNLGNKGLLELFEEIHKREAELFLRLHKGILRAVRVAKRVRVFIYDSLEEWWLCERARKYFGNDITIAIKEYALSGCIQEHEPLKEAAQRETEQELKIRFPLESFDTQRFLVKDATLLGEDSTHESNAYYGLLSQNQDYDVGLKLDVLPEEWFSKPPEIDDTRVTVYTCVLPQAKVPFRNPTDMPTHLAGMLSVWARETRQ